MSAVAARELMYFEKAKKYIFLGPHKKIIFSPFLYGGGNSTSAEEVIQNFF